MDKTDLMQLAYDTEADVLYLSIGEPRRAVSREIGDDVLLRVDPDNGSIIGLPILNDLPIKVALQAVPAA